MKKIMFNDKKQRLDIKKEYTISKESLMQHCKRQIAKFEVFNNANDIKRMEEHEILLRLLEGEDVKQIFGTKD